VESGPADYTPGSWSCDGGTQDGSTITLGLNDHVTCTINNDDIAICAIGDRVTSVNLEVMALTSSSANIKPVERHGQAILDVRTNGVNANEIVGAVVGTTFSVEPLDGAANFATQNLGFMIDGVLSSNLRVHLSCSDGPAVGDVHIGEEAVLIKTSFTKGPNQ
jgi:hypothetical protein